MNNCRTPCAGISTGKPHQHRRWTSLGTPPPFCKACPNSTVPLSKMTESDESSWADDHHSTNEVSSELLDIHLSPSGFFLDLTLLHMTVFGSITLHKSESLQNSRLFNFRCLFTLHLHELAYFGMSVVFFIVSLQIQEMIKKHR